MVVSSAEGNKEVPETKAIVRASVKVKFFC